MLKMCQFQRGIHAIFPQNLMIMEQSDIIEYYPVNFKTDLNGKQQEWEAVVLIPFIDEVSFHVGVMLCWVLCGLDSIY